MRFQCMKFESAHRLFNLERVRLSILDFGFWIGESFELKVGATVAPHAASCRYRLFFYQ